MYIHSEIPKINRQRQIFILLLLTMTDFIIENDVTALTAAEQFIFFGREVDTEQPSDQNLIIIVQQK